MNDLRAASQAAHSLVSWLHRRISFSVCAGALLVVIAAASAQENSAAFERAHALLEQGKTADAIDLLRSISDRQPTIKGLARELGVAYYRSSDYSQAVPYLKQDLKENAEDKEAIQLLGLSYYFTGKYADAIPLLEQAQTWYSVANVDAAYVLGLCYTLTHNYDSARTAFARMFGVPPDSAPAYLVTARMLLRQDFKEVAQSYVEIAIKKDPRLPLAHNLLGESYLLQSKIDEAIAQLNAELEINPGYADTYYKLADAYDRIQHLDEAQRLLQRSIWLDSTATGPYILLGKVLAEKGETELAVRTLEHAIALDPNNPIPHYLLGRSYGKLGRSEDQEREMKLVVQLRDAKNAKP